MKIILINILILILEKSLLLGIARKESIFIQYAKSSAGALGDNASSS
jgi:hypothetical protein